MYSQNNEEEIISRKFDGLVGTFLDIGAFDGVNLSNTRLLSEIGWSGVMVEGSSFSFHKLFDLYAGNEKITLINAMISKEIIPANKIVKMWESPNSALSTVDFDNFKKWEKYVQDHSEGGIGFSEIYVPIVPFDEIIRICLEKHQTVDFVSIDIEGGSVDIAKQFNPDQFWTNMICVEHDGRDEELVEHFRPMGFKVDLMNAENLIVSR